MKNNSHPPMVVQTFPFQVGYIPKLTVHHLGIKLLFDRKRLRPFPLPLCWWPFHLASSLPWSVMQVGDIDLSWFFALYVESPAWKAEHIQVVSPSIPSTVPVVEDPYAHQVSKLSFSGCTKGSSWAWVNRLQYSTVPRRLGLMTAVRISAIKSYLSTCTR